MSMYEYWKVRRFYGRMLPALRPIIAAGAVKGERTPRRPFKPDHADVVGDDAVASVVKPCR